MDFDSSSKFIASLAKFLQSLCNGYVDFDKGVEVIGHIYINVDSDTGKKVDYVLNEKVCKNDNSITFISNSFHAQPAEKPKPPPKKAAEPEKQEETIVMDDSGQTLPNSTNVGTLGSYRSPSSRAGPQDSYPVGSKRPRTPPQHRGIGKIGNTMASKLGMPPSPRYQDSGGPAAKIGRADIPPSPLNSGSVGGNRNDYEGANVFHSGGEDDDSENYSSNFLDDQNSSEIDQKPVIDPDISIVKEEYISNQSSCSYSGSGQTSGPGRGKSQAVSAYPVMLHQSPSNYAGSAVGPPSLQQDMYAGSSLEGAGDPSIARQLNSTSNKHELVRLLGRKKRCVQCSLNLKKTESGRAPETVYGCKFCDVHLCKAYCYVHMAQSEEELKNWLTHARCYKQDPFPSNSTGRGSAKTSQIIRSDGSVRYMCDHCGKHYKHYRDLIRHRYQCLNKKVIVCRECAKTFFRTDALTTHMKKCHSDSLDFA